MILGNVFSLLVIVRKRHFFIWTHLYFGLLLALNPKIDLLEQAVARLTILNGLIIWDILLLGGYLWNVLEVFKALDMLSLPGAEGVIRDLSLRRVQRKILGRTLLTAFLVALPRKTDLLLCRNLWSALLWRRNRELFLRLGQSLLG